MSAALHGPAWWVGRISMALALTLNGDKWIGRETLKEFLASPAVAADLRKMLREELRK